MKRDLLTNKMKDLNKVGVSKVLCQNIEDFILHTEDGRLYNISPFRIAQNWNMDRHEVLNAFLYGSKLGIFDLEWNIRCPACTNAIEKTQSLKELTSSSHCDYCKIDINAAFDDDVEITFNINKNIKNLTDVSLDEISMAWIKFEETITIEVEPNSSSEIHLSLDNGIYYMINMVKKTGAPLIIEDGGLNDSAINFKFEDGIITREHTEVVESGKVVIKLVNKDNNPIETIFIKAKEFPWVSGADIVTNQLFRDYFSTELISADETFSIKNMVFVFTDIKGSTDLYEKRGDSKAYYLVKKHFKIMTDIVKKYNGSIVKTIGDAVMATFLSSEDSIKAVFEMQEEFDAFNLKEESRDDIIIKIGLHRGGCLAVTSNDKLDYFGRTVNIAARVQGLSGGNDIMISNDLYDEHGIGDLIDTYNWKTKEMEATLKGIDGLFKVTHIYR